MIFSPQIPMNINGKDVLIDPLSCEFHQNRTISITGEINDEVATIVNASLRYLAMTSNDDIVVYINSPGGSVKDGLAIYDTMQYIKCDVSTICVGVAASMGAFLLSGGTKGKRFALPNSSILIHQPLIAGHGLIGQTTDIEIAAKNLVQTKERLNRILADNCGKTVDELARDTDRDNWFTAQEALEYGIIDNIIKEG